MKDQHLNDELGQEASDFLTRDKEIEEAVRAMLGSNVGGHYGPKKKPKGRKKKDNGK